MAPVPPIIVVEVSPDRRRRRVLVVVLAAQVSETFEEAELPTIDTRFRVRDSQGPPTNVVVVEIDDVTLQEVGESWPFSLDLYARAVETLTDAGAAAIVLAYQALQRAVMRCPSTAWSGVSTTRPGTTMPTTMTRRSLSRGSRRSQRCLSSQSSRQPVKNSRPMYREAKG
jgi:hypothetical protein